MKWEDFSKTYKELSKEDRKIVDSYKRAKEEDTKYWQEKFPNGIQIVEGFFDCTEVVFKCPYCGEFHKTVESVEDVIPRIYGSKRHLVDFICWCDGEETIMRIQARTRLVRYWEPFDY